MCADKDKQIHLILERFSAQTPLHPPHPPSGPKLPLIQVDQRGETIHPGAFRAFLSLSIDLGGLWPVREPRLWVNVSQAAPPGVTWAPGHWWHSPWWRSSSRSWSPHVQAPVRAAGQSHGGQQLVPVSQAVAAGAGDAAPAPVAHHAADYRRLLGDEDVLPVPHVKNP